MEKAIITKYNKAVNEGKKITARIMGSTGPFRTSPLRKALNTNFRTQRRLLGELVRAKAAV